MIGIKTYDLFITHAWRYHDDWKRLVNLLNAHNVRAWRNFSLPWYDPALDPRTEEGGKLVRWHLETQIIPAQAVVLLSSVLSEPGTRKWLDLELAMARKHGKPVIAIPAWGETEVPPEVRATADTAVGWDAAALLAAVDQAAHRPAAGIAR
jgi:hypothetical protein